MSGPTTSNPVRCGDVKQALRIHSGLLTDLEATLYAVRPDLAAILLRGEASHGVDPFNPPPIIMGKGCQFRLDLPTLDDLSVATAMVYMRALLQVPWAILSAMPDDHLFDLPPVIEPLGLPGATAGEAQG